MNIFSSLKERVIGSKRTTIGGGVGGVILMAIIGKLEEMSGCKFSVAFGNIDWIQFIVFVYSLVVGAITTDSDKTIVDKSNSGS